MINYTNIFQYIICEDISALVPRSRDLCLDRNKSLYRLIVSELVISIIAL